MMMMAMMMMMMMMMMMQFSMFQAIRDGVHKAQQEVNAAGSEKSKAEAMIALECYEALQKALEGN
jgi:hypothetical protein